MQEPDIKEIRNKVYELVDDIKKTTAPSTIAQFQPQLIGLSTYLSNYDTQQLLKLNSKLANATIWLAVATFILAFASVALAIITYMKP